MCTKTNPGRTAVIQRCVCKNLAWRSISTVNRLPSLRLWHSADKGRDGDVVVFGGSQSFIFLMDSVCVHLLFRKCSRFHKHGDVYSDPESALKVRFEAQA